MEREIDQFNKPSEADYTGHSEKQIDIVLENGVGEGTSKKQTTILIQPAKKKKTVTLFEAKEEE